MVCTLALSYGPLLIIPNAKQMGGGGTEIFITLLALGVRVQELYESRGGRPGLPVLMSLVVSVDVKQH